MDKILKKIYSPNVEVLLWPFLVIVVVIVLSFVVVKNGYSRINTQLENLKNTKSTENILSHKITVLREIPPGILEKTNVVVISLPEDNPGVFMTSQIKNYTSNYSLLLDKIEVGTPNTTQEDIFSADVKASYTFSDLQGVLGFLKSLSFIAPVSRLEEVKIGIGTEGSLSADTKLTVYWSNLPTVLPPLTEPINELSEEEKSLLFKVANLNFPEFTVLYPSQAQDRLNPFK